MNLNSLRIIKAALEDMKISMLDPDLESGRRDELAHSAAVTIEQILTEENVTEDQKPLYRNLDGVTAMIQEMENDLQNA